MKTGDCANTNIGCSVTECKYHDQNQQYCTLQHINIVKDSTIPSVTSKEATDCGSFQINDSTTSY